jgi:hypothetical protein
MRQVQGMALASNARVKALPASINFLRFQLQKDHTDLKRGFS